MTPKKKKNEVESTLPVRDNLMSDTVVKNSFRTIKATAVITAVVFLLLGAGCHHGKSHTHHRESFEPNKDVHRRQQDDRTQPRKQRRRARDYSRLPGNYPADWQRSTIGR
jgi:hypothetical protein